MSEDPPDASPSKIVYAEYTRLSAASERMTHSSLDDFKLLAVVGAMVGLQPVSDYLKGDGGKIAVSSLFVGFMGLLFIVAVIAFRDTLKQSLIVYLGEHLTRYENILRVMYSCESNGLFRTYSEAEQWAAEKHAKLVVTFNIFILLPVAGIPAFVLSRYEVFPYWNYTYFYLATCGGVYFLYYYLSKIYLRKRY